MKKLILSLLALFVISVGFAQTPISEVQGEQDASPMEGQTVTIKGIVTGSGDAAPGYFIQDGDGPWSGIYIYDPARSPKPAIGDEVELTGEVSEYYTLTEISNLTDFNILSSGNTLPSPIEIATGDDLEMYEGVLVSVKNATCTAASLGYGEWEINDGSGAIVVNDFFYAFTPTEGLAYDVTGPLDFSFDFFKIEPRFPEDIQINAALYFTQEPYQTHDLSKNSITIAWETNIASISKIEYGLTEALELGSLDGTSATTNHEITINGLNAGELYYVKAYSVVDEESTPAEIKAYTTVSNSSGQINVCFTNPQYAMLTGESNVLAPSDLSTGSIADTIVSYINKATQTLDIAIYDVHNHATQSDNTNQKIFDAIKAKANAGIKVRLITDDESTDDFFTELMTNANVMWGNSDGIMHHKFVVVDAASEKNSWLVSGSTNWTYNNLVMDANNLIAIQDQSLAKAYTAEFNEMWGGPQDNPDYTKSKFGLYKTNNTPHLFEIGGKNIELYFSPSDKTESKIIEAIENANYEIAFSIMAFTSDGIGAALIDAYDRGVVIKGVIDYVEYSGSEYERLFNHGLDVIDYANPDGESWPDNITIHHKFIVTDYNHPDSDPTLVTGTHNWSASAESRNDENTLVIHDAELAALYAYETDYIYSVGTATGINETVFRKGMVFPNPAAEKLHIRTEETVSKYAIINQTGAIVLKGILPVSDESIDISELPQGMYLINYRVENGKNYSSLFIKK